MQGDIHSSNANLTGFIKTCENRAVIDQDCPHPFNFTVEDFIWPENQSQIQVIHLKEDKYGLQDISPHGGYFVLNDTVTVCIKHYGNLPFLPNSEGFYAVLSSVLLISSIVGLYLTIITHCLFSELRNLPGLNLLAMNTTMVLYQQLFVAGIAPSPSPDSSPNSNLALCKGIAITLHFLILSTFFWTNVMAWDLYQVHGLCLPPPTNLQLISNSFKFLPWAKYLAFFPAS